MILKLKRSAKLENFTNHTAETVESLRTLLTAGALAHPDPRRKDFYEVENASRVFFVHLTRRGDVWLLASWLKTASSPLAGFLKVWRAEVPVPLD